MVAAIRQHCQSGGAPPYRPTIEGSTSRYPPYTTASTEAALTRSNRKNLLHKFHTLEVEIYWPFKQFFLMVFRLLSMTEKCVMCILLAGSKLKSRSAKRGRLMTGIGICP